MRFYPRKNSNFKPFMRLLAGVMAGVLSFTIGLPGRELFAQPYAELWEKSKQELTRYVDRASRFAEEEAWTNYLELGIATQRTEWERAALDLLDERIENIESQAGEEAAEQAEIEAAVADYQAARNVWESDAENLLLEERGKYRAHEEAVDVAEVAESEYEAMIASAEAAVAGDPAADLDAWLDAIQPAHVALKDGFEQALNAELDRARSNNAGLDQLELDAFESELAEIEERVRREFQTRDNFYVIRARNRYIALLRSDEVSARLASEAQSAEAIGDALIEDTAAELSAETDSLLDAAVAGSQSALEGAEDPDLDSIGNNWEQQIETVIDTGLRKWELAEEDLYKKRLAWMTESKKTRAEAEEIWRANHEKLKSARDDWLAEIETQIVEGRNQWQEKLNEFDRNRQAAEEELAEYIARERERWDASSGELGDMVSGGGAALLEAQDAYRYYDTLLANMGQPSDPDNQKLFDFYTRQRDYMGGAIARFENILGEVEGVLPETLHSTDGHTGLLRDVRVFAGDLPEVVAGLSEADFRAELENEMSSRGEDFLLYRRDLDELIGRNLVFVERAGELAASSQFDYNAATDLAGLEALVAGVDRKYDEHRREIDLILNQDRGALDDAAKLAAIKTDLSDWFARSRDENVRLKQETLAYFNNGGAGYYLTEEEGDPYLMTKAEYEWELLRRERNYLAKKLQRAEAVKQYADLAFQHEAGLEMAAVTAERAAVARVHSQIKEIAYKLIRGDFALDPAATTDPAVADAEFDAVLGQYDIDPAALFAREDQLDREIAEYEKILAPGQPDIARIIAMLADVEAYLAADVAEESRAAHPLGILREKLIDYRNAYAGASVQERSDRWATITGGVGLIRDQTVALKTDFNFDSLRDDLGRVRTLVGTPGLPALAADLAGVKAEIEANARLLQQAAGELDLARQTYREARIDFESLRSGSAGEIIQKDLQSTSRALSGVLHRMVKLENIPGLDPAALYDPATARSVEYLYEISARETARGELNHADEILQTLQGLEEAKKRSAELESLVGSTDFGALAPEALAHNFLSRRSQLIVTGAADESLNSHANATGAMDALAAARDAYLSARQELDDAIAGGEPALTIELHRLDLSREREAITASVQSLIAAVRGETEARRRQVYHELDVRAPGGEPLVDPAAQKEAVQTRTQELTEAAFALSTATAVELESFLEANREADFATLLARANDEVQTAQNARQVHAGISPFGTGATAEPTVAENEFQKWNLVRAWLVNNQATIDYLAQAPGVHDSRTVAEKWDSLLEGIGEMAGDADYYLTFQNDLPASAADPRIVAHRQAREDALARLETTLGASDADLKNAYDSLALADRDLLAGYASSPGALEDAPGGVLLRPELETVRHRLRAELAAMETDYLAIYLNEEVRTQSARLAQLQTELGEKTGALNGARQEQSELTANRESRETELAAETDPARRAALQAEIQNLDDRLLELDDLIQRLETDSLPLQTEHRRLSKVLKEITSPGSTAALFPAARDELRGYYQNMDMMSWGANLLEQGADETATDEDLSTADRLKAIIGFYATDERGDVKRDASGDFILSQEFADLGITDPEQAILDGGHAGADLQRWAARLSVWQNQNRNARDAAPELVAAVDLLESSIQDYLAAKMLIDNRDLSAADLNARAEREIQESREKLKQLARVQELEAEIKRAVELALQEERDPIAAVLPILNRPATVEIFQLFDGVDANGDPDLAGDPEARARVDELVLLAGRLRELQNAARIQELSAGYAQLKSVFIQGADPANPGPTAAEYLAVQSGLDSAGVAAAVDGITADANFRANLALFLEGATAADVLYVNEIWNLLGASPRGGADLKSEVLAALTALETRVRESLEADFARSDFHFARNVELNTTQPVADLMNAYATRGTFARDTFGPVVSGVAAAASLSDTRNLLKTKVNELLDGAAFASLRRDLIQKIDASTDVPALKTELTGYLNGLEDPEAAAVDQLSEQLSIRNLNLAMATAATADTYAAEDYPEDLRELILVRGYGQANERYAEYLADRGSDLETRRAAARLDLRGLPADFARSILARDLDAFAAAVPAADFLARPDTGGELARGRSLNEYLNEYFQDRRTAPELLPANADLAFERAAAREYLRLNADATGAGGIFKLDEGAYFADFRDYLLLAKLDEFVTRTGYTLTGADEAAKRAHFEAAFETMLDDPTYEIAGRSLRERMLADAERTGFLNLAFAHLNAGDELNDYLPGPLALRESEGRLADPLETPESYLPADLLSIAGYQSLDYRDLAAAAGQAVQQELARQEIVAAGGIDAGLNLSAADAEAVFERAGYTNLPADVRAELTEFLRRHTQERIVGPDASIDEALHRIRQELVLDDLFPTQADQRELELFLTRQEDRIDSIDNKFFAALESRSAALRDLTKQERGQMIMALAVRSGGGTNAFYNGLSAELKAEVDGFADDLLGASGSLSAAEKTALQGESVEFSRVFDLRSAQELSANEIFKNADQWFFSGLLRSVNDSDLAFARENRVTALRAMIETLYVEAGRLPGTGAGSAAFLSARPGMEATVGRIVADMDPDLKDNLLEEQILVTRFLDRFQESDALRNEIDSLLGDPAVLNPVAALEVEYESRKTMVLLERENHSLAGALLDAVNSHQNFYAEYEVERNREYRLAGRLRTFAAERGTDPNFQDNRFSHYRTFIGAEEPYNRGDYDQYLAGLSPGETPQTYDEFHGGMLLQGQDLGGGETPESLLGRADWEDILISDRAGPAGTVLLDQDTPETDDDVTVAYRAVFTVSTPDRRQAEAPDNDARMRYVYYENLANNYLEAVSRLNRSLANVFTAANMADRREANTADAELARAIRDNYDATAQAPEDLSAVLSRKQTLQADFAEHSPEAVNQKLGAVQAVAGQMEEAAGGFADAGRRGLLMGMQLGEYLETVFNDASRDLEAAEAEVDRLSALAEANRVRDAGANRVYVDTLNDMAEWMRQFAKANDEYELRRAVKEYAETPYLFATADDASAGTDFDQTITEYRGDAREEYERALAALTEANQKLQEAGYAVQTQDRLPEFNAIVAVLEGADEAAKTSLREPLSAAEGDELLTLRDRKFNLYETLSAADETRLLELSRRELYSRHRDLIEERADYIKHAMRMVRINKASEIVNAEIERRKSVADMKRQKFQSLLDTALGGNFDRDANEGDWAARNSVYLRMVGLLEGGGNFHDEYRAWYYNTGGEFPTDTRSQVRERDGSAALNGAMNALDRNAVARWVNAGGMVAEFGQFQGIYNAMLHASGHRDNMLDEYNIIKNTYIPVKIMGFYFYGIGLTAGFWTPWNYIFIPIGLGMIAAADNQINIARVKYEAAEQHRATLDASARGVAHAGSVRQVLDAQYEYEDALAALTYFTKVPDMQVLKERMVQWGDQHGDTRAGSAEDLYQLTDEDLKYLFDSLGPETYIDSNGDSQNLSAQEQSDAMDVTANKADAEFSDVFGRRYDPYRTVDAPPGPLEGGVYRGADGDYVRIKKTRHDGSSYWSYARLLDDPDNTPPDKAYHMGGIYQQLVDHGNRLLDERRNDYISRGNADPDASFILAERDATMKALFDRATARADGGREFSGYRSTFQDYLNNSGRIHERELAQRQAVQIQDWDLRERELRDSYEAWERKVATILARGKKSWSGAEDRYLQRWRSWEREFDQEIAEGEKVWDERVAKHFSDKANWEKDLRAQASEVTIENLVGTAVDQLNSQIDLARSNLGSDFARMDKIATINNAVSEMRRGLPTGGRTRIRINADIKNFNVNLTAGQLLGRDLQKGNFQIGQKFQKEMQAHKKQMRVLANVKVFEQYRQMMENFKASIRVQNQQIENQTTAAALAQGYVRSGDVFVRSSGMSGHSVRVDAYKWFDADRALEEELARNGYAAKTGDDLVSFLEGSSQVEVESYFYVQKMAMQKAFQAIMGAGSAAERKGQPRDTKVIGRFSAWVGDAGKQLKYGEILGETLTRAGLNAESAKKMQIAEFKAVLIDLKTGDHSTAKKQALIAMLGTIKDRELQTQEAQESGIAPLINIDDGTFLAATLQSGFALGGFGELGSGGQRPGGAPLGFYPQLKQASQEIAKKDQEWLEDASSSLDPFSSLVNAFNPIMWGAEAVKNYRIGVEVYGKDPSDMLWAQIANVGKSIAQAAGTVLMATGIGTAIGAALIVASNMMQVDAVNGKVGFKLTDQALISSLTTVAGTFLPGAQALGGTIGAQVGSAAMQFGLNTISSGFQYDADGGLSGFGFKSGKQFLANQAISMAGSALGSIGGKIGGKAGGFGARLGSAFGSRAATTFGEYFKKEAGMENNYAAMTRSDGSAWGSLLGGMAGSAIKESKWYGSVNQKVQNLWSDLAGKKQQKQAGLDVMRGLAYRREEEEQDFSLKREDFGEQGVLLGAAWDGVKALGGMLGSGIARGASWLGKKMAAGASWVSRKAGWESGANWLDGNGYRSDDELFRHLTLRNSPEQLSRSQKNFVINMMKQEGHSTLAIAEYKEVAGMQSELSASERRELVRSQNERILLATTDASVVNSARKATSAEKVAPKPSKASLIRELKTARPHERDKYARFLVENNLLPWETVRDTYEEGKLLSDIEIAEGKFVLGKRTDTIAALKAAGIEFEDRGKKRELWIDPKQSPEKIRMARAISKVMVKWYKGSKATHRAMTAEYKQKALDRELESYDTGLRLNFTKPKNAPSGAYHPKIGGKVKTWWVRWFEEETKIMDYVHTPKLSSHATPRRAKTKYHYNDEETGIAKNKMDWPYTNDLVPGPNHPFKVLAVGPRAKIDKKYYELVSSNMGTSIVIEAYDKKGRPFHYALAHHVEINRTVYEASGTNRLLPGGTLLGKTGASGWIQDKKPSWAKGSAAFHTHYSFGRLNGKGGRLKRAAAMRIIGRYE